MNWSVYADLSRSLTEEERRSIAGVLDEAVANGGCIGQDKGEFDEVYFQLVADSRAEASATAANLMEDILEKAGVQAQYRLELQPVLGT